MEVSSGDFSFGNSAYGEQKCGCMKSVANAKERLSTTKLVTEENATTVLLSSSVMNRGHLKMGVVIQTATTMTIIMSE